MRRYEKRIVAAAALFLCLSLVGVVRAENEGQTDLDRATEAKLNAQSIEDLTRVIKLCQDALDAGLDKANTQYATELLAGTLTQRAEVVTSQITSRPLPPAQLQRLRKHALDDLERAAKLSPDNADTHFLIARLNSTPGGDREQAITALGNAIRLSASEPARKAKYLLLRAKLLKEDDKRRADYDEAVKLLPGDVEPLRERGRFLLSQNKPIEALADFDNAIKLKPDQNANHEARAIALIMQKKFDDALASLNKAIELDSDSAMAYLYRGQVHAIKQDRKRALEDVNRVLELAPRFPTALLLRARIHQAGGDTKKALADVELVLRDRPGSVEALQLHAALAAGTGKLRQAIDDLEQLRESVPEDADLLLQLATLYSAGKHSDKAIAVFDKLIAKDPKNWAAYRGRADAYLNIGRQGPAISDYEAALKIEPKEAGVLNNLAWVLATSPEDKLRDGKRAVDLATEAAKVTEYKQAHILSTLAAAYAEAGNFEEALKWSKKSLEVAGDDKIKSQLNKELASYEARKPWREAQPPEEPPDDDALNQAASNDHQPTPADPDAQDDGGDPAEAADAAFEVEPEVKAPPAQDKKPPASESSDSESADPDALFK